MPALPPYKLVRCRYFDAHGKPIAPYCELGALHCNFLHPSDVRIASQLTRYAVIQAATDSDPLQRDFPGVEPRPKLPHPDTPHYLPPSRKRHRSPPSSTFGYSPRSSGLRSRSDNYSYSRAPPSSYAIRPVSPLYNSNTGKHRRTSTATGANAQLVRSKEPDTLIVQNPKPCKIERGVIAHLEKIASTHSHSSPAPLFIPRSPDPDQTGSELENTFAVTQPLSRDSPMPHLLILIREIVKVQLRVEETRKEYDEECIKHDAFQAITTKLVLQDEPNPRIASPSAVGGILGMAAARAAVLETLKGIQARKEKMKEQLKQDMDELCAMWERLWEKWCKAADQHVAKAVEEKFKNISGSDKSLTTVSRGTVSMRTAVDCEDGTTRKSRKVSFEDERRISKKELEARKQIEDRVTALEKRVGEKGWARASRVAALEKQNNELQEELKSQRLVLDTLTGVLEQYGRLLDETARTHEVEDRLATFKAEMQMQCPPTHARME